MKVLREITIVDKFSNKKERVWKEDDVLTAQEETDYVTRCAQVINEFLNHTKWARDHEETVGDYLTRRCPECQKTDEEMSTIERGWHRIVSGFVIVGCEGYWVINPNTRMMGGVRLGGDGSKGLHWSDWTFEQEGEIDPNDTILNDKDWTEQT
jgi:hypothetical protein